MPALDTAYTLGKELFLLCGSRKALLVPSSYITRRYGIDYVTILAKDGASTEVPVQTVSAADTSKAEILSGVSAGDTLIDTHSGTKRP